MLGVEAIPAIAFLAAILFVPESPRWLIIKRGKTEEARATLQAANPAGTDVDSIVSDIVRSARNAGNQTAVPFFSKQYRTPIMLAVLFCGFQSGFRYQCNYLLCAPHL